MLRLGLNLFAGALVSFAANAVAGDLHVQVLDKHKDALADAVILVSPESRAANADTAIPTSAQIGQDDLTFIPKVTLVRPGAGVTFTNNDTTGHHVYSFSPIKQFQLVLKKGEKSSPVIFDKPGIAAVGCNIHDQMLAYVYVSDAPLGIVTKDGGAADFTGLASGKYKIEVWHPEMRAGDRPVAQAVTIADGENKASFVLPVSKPAPHNMRMRDY